MGKYNDWQGGGGVVTPVGQNKNYVNAGQEDEMEIFGYYPSKRNGAITWIFIVLTVGLLRLVFYWKPEWMLKATHVKCSLQKATKILLKDQYEQWFVEDVLKMTLDIRSDKTEGTNYMGEQATHADITDDIDTDDLPLVEAANSGVVYYFVSKRVKYVWDSATEMFMKLKGLETEQTCSYFHEAKPLTQAEMEQQRMLHGDNVIDVRVDSVLKLLLTQSLNPFYMFQVFSCILWFVDEYMVYASCIVIMSVISLTMEIYQTRAMQRALKSTISGNTIVSVCRGEDEYEDIPSDLLVPGDIIEVPRHGCIMQCDAVLLTGNCIVNESMLTGESVPVTKTPLPDPLQHPDAPRTLYSLKEHSRHTLFCGTHVIQTRYYGKQKVKAVVLRTGFSTLKGELVRSILFPKPVDFKFAADTYKFIGVLAAMSCGGMIYTIIVMARDGFGVGMIIVRMLDLVTIVIPPALPAAMTIGTVFAQRRLKKQGIFCISPKSITLCGAINTFCFDKTGTLTEDGLDMYGVVPARDSSFSEELKNIPDLAREPLMIAMATCHSLTIIEGQISGDPLDVRMFESTQWVLEEPGDDSSKFDVFMPTLVRPKTPDIVRTSENFDSSENIPFEVGILRQFTFSSKLQRMSVIARTLSKPHFDLYAKGAPEMIVSLCKPHTVPGNFHEVLLKYTQHGYRVLALAWKPLKKLNYVKVQRAQREQMERDLVFLGLLVMENRLKPSTMPIIRQLKEANIRTIMVTGDNMLTALSVARDCHMLESCDRTILVQVVPPSVDGVRQPCVQWNYADETSGSLKEVMTKRLKEMVTVPIDINPRSHFAITGKSWTYIREYFPELVYKLVIKGTVFARFSPEQKQQLVETLQELGYYVGMCGDGANDCGALKTAHAGISLSEAEASVASPFTSKTPDISCVPTAIREGRAALVTSFGVFKYMAGYSLTQFVSVCMLYWIGANLTDFTFLYIDLFMITTLAATFGYTGAYPQLSREAPPISLISLMPILSIIVQILLMMSFQVISWILVMNQPWFEAYSVNDEDDYNCYEMTVLFGVSSFQYVTLAVVFSKGAPYRKTLFSNWFFLGNILLLTALNVWVVIYPTDRFADFLEIKMFPSLPFRGIIIGLAIGNFFLSYFLETYLLDNGFIRRRCAKQLELRSERNDLKYLSIEKEMKSAPEWPPVSQDSHSLAQLMQLETTPQHVETTPQHVETTPQHVETNHQCVESTPQHAETTPQHVGTTPRHVETTPHHMESADPCLRVESDHFVEGGDRWDGRSDVCADSSTLNTPSKPSNTDRRSSPRKRIRTESTTSTSSRFSLSPVEILNDLSLSSDKLMLSEHAEDIDGWETSEGIVTVSRQLPPDSPRSPSIPLLAHHFVPPDTDPRLVLPAASNDTFHFSNKVSGPLFPNETQL